MDQTVQRISEDGYSDGWQPISPEEFARRLKEQTADWCARALSPVLQRQPALMRAVERNELHCWYCVGGWSSNELGGFAHASAPIGEGGASAVLVEDALPRAREPTKQAEADRIATALAAKLSTASTDPHDSPRLGNAPEAARILGLKTVGALYKRVRDGNMPPGSVVRISASRMQFRLDKLLNAPTKARRKRAQ
jgi:hypothetical protein